jgi:TPR repeat protein
MLFPNTTPREPGVVAGGDMPPLDGLSRSGTPVQPARLVVEGHTAFANEPIPLGVSLNGGSGGEMLTLVGLATGTKLTAGAPLGPTSWQLSARDIGKAYAYAPKDFVGVMDAAVDLRSPRDRLMDSQFVRLEWIQKKEALWEPKPELSKPALNKPEPTKPELNKPEPSKLEPTKPPPAVYQLGPEEIATLIKRGEDFLKYGDVASARLSLRRAASAGNAQAALGLGATFDPAFLSERGILGFAPDVAQARAWYEKAAELGSIDAVRRLERLSRRAQ